MIRPCLGLLVALAACEPVPPGDLADVTFPPGFALDARSEVVITLAAARPDVLSDATVTVRLADGAPLLEAPLADVLGAELRVRLPPDVRAVAVEVRSPAGDQVLAGTIVDGRVTVEVP